MTVGKVPATAVVWRAIENLSFVEEMKRLLILLNELLRILYVSKEGIRSSHGIQTRHHGRAWGLIII